MLDESWLIALTSLDSSSEDLVESYDFSKEKSSILAKFDFNDAFELGSLARSLAQEAFPGKPVVIDISQPNGHGLFRAVADNGSSLDNDFWVERKKRTAMRFNCSSYFMGLKLRDSKKSPEDKYFVDSKDYAFYGGALPIFLDATEFPVACITVSGLKPYEDHWLAVQCLNEFMATKTEKDLGLD
ncbi:related to UPF0303 protein YBR137W [Zygosaccharomyces bailii ISA1307]|uniref:BN860_10286g1_1 n=1 Tax=Zygosaccharomyces bailii (strain CLIB 213 / ATCC 58445 / CBS 680 / BCRC 21525 / NBRC 1098 / NCYC 1416 / NRRL Y-2227) TaxID=1333698 RepID=A0A8J2X5A3_ZYGB2|nr:BN860_10286g1_1 [Zygosaccharomyces bailii CLIB 213]CDH15339.1 related to UPF0303 protein YBR137W [Zygosaccharomyces bailii ISA1307]